MNKQTRKGIENLETTDFAQDIAVSSKSNEQYETVTDESEKTTAETCRAGLND